MTFSISEYLSESLLAHSCSDEAKALRTHGRICRLPTPQKLGNVDTSLKKSKQRGIEIGNENKTTLPGSVSNHVLINHSRCF